MSSPKNQEGIENKGRKRKGRGLDKPPVDYL
jgi:hypothetical protein